MEFHEKLQQLRKQKGLTQEQLAERLFVSRTAVSKWESGRGFPNIDSLKAISQVFSVKLDDLLSGDALLDIARQDQLQKQDQLQDLLFGLLDCAMALLLFLPFFGQAAESGIREVSLLNLMAQPLLKGAFLTVVACMIITGIVTLALQTCSAAIWLRSKRTLSLLLNTAGVLIFIISRQPYAASFVFVFLAIKVFVLLKRL